MTDRPWETPPSGSLADIARALAAQLPRIETARLVLRAPRMEDFAAYADIVTSERWFDVPQTRDEAWLDFSQTVAGWMLAGTGLLSIDRTEDGRLVGFVLVHHEYGDPERELGWLLTAAGEGHGYATEAAAALRRHAAETHGLVGLVSYIAPENAASVRVAERLDARRDPIAEAAVGHSCVVYRHPVVAA